MLRREGGFALFKAEQEIVFADAEFFHLEAHVGFGQAEGLGGAALVAGKAAQGFLDELFFELRHRRAQGLQLQIAELLIGFVKGEQLRQQLVFRRGEHQVAHHVFQLLEIARPGMLEHLVKDLEIDGRHRPAQLCADALEKVLDQNRDILLALGQRRQFDGHLGEQKKKIPIETAVLHLVVDFGGGGAEEAKDNFIIYYLFGCIGKVYLLLLKN